MKNLTLLSCMLCAVLPVTSWAQDPGGAKPPPPAPLVPAVAVPDIVPEAGPAPKARKAEEEEEVVVITATRTPQKIEEAPSIVTVLTHEEIMNMGYLSIGEVLRNVVGVGINDNGHWPDTGIRGINDRTTYGDKILMLVDGHDMSWRQFLRNYHNPTWADVQDIARIEVVRGPGSALWGANALTGVVNIVTRDWSTLNGGEVTYGANHRFGSQFISARAGKTWGDAAFYGTVSYYQDNPDALLAPIRELQLLSGQIYDDVGNAANGVNLSLKAKYKWFQATFHKSRYDVGAPLSTFSVVGGKDSRFITDRHIFTLSFQKMLFAGFDLTARFDFDDNRFADGTVYEANPGSATVGDPAHPGTGRALVEMAAIDRRYEGKVQAVYLPTPKIQAVAGAEVEYLDLVRWYYPQVWAYQSLPVPKFTNFRVGTYLQAQYSPVRMIGLTGGVRMDYDQIYGFVATPRAGVVVRLPRGLYLKGLFGSAYKAPSFHDLYYFRQDAFYGNPSVTPERCYTGEGQVGYRSGMVDARLTGFYVYVKDLIGYATRAKGTPLDNAGVFPASQLPTGTKDYSQKTNVGHVSSAGIEGELLVRPLSWLRLTLNGTYRVPRDENGNRLPYDSQWTVGGSASVRLGESVLVTFRGIGVGNKWVPAQALSQVGFPTFTAAQDPTLDAPGYFMGTFMIAATNVWHSGLSLSLKLDNITNTEYWDAGRDVLYPQRKFQGMIWASLSI